jgi:hypothetical protein
MRPRPAWRTEFQVCHAHYILHDARSYACSGHKGGACENHIRVRRDALESAIQPAVLVRDAKDCRLGGLHCPGSANADQGEVAPSCGLPSGSIDAPSMQPV